MNSGFWVLGCKLWVLGLRVGFWGLGSDFWGSDLPGNDQCCSRAQPPRASQSRTAASPPRMGSGIRECQIRNWGPAMRNGNQGRGQTIKATRAPNYPPFATLFPLRPSFAAPQAGVSRRRKDSSVPTRRVSPSWPVRDTRPPRQRCAPVEQGLRSSMVAGSSFRV